MSHARKGQLRAVLLCVLCAMVWANSLQELVNKREGLVKAIRDRAQTLHTSRCTKDCSCLGADLCLGGLNTTCVDDLGQGQNCDCTGRPVLLGSSGIYIPSTVNRKDAGVKESACYTKELDSLFISKYKELANTKWTYFGTKHGVHRKYPGNVWPRTDLGGCSAYDPRTRPWYVAASSGPKDVILIIDVSGSMAQNKRLTIAKEAANSVVGTLTSADFVTVVKFSDTASSASAELKQANNVTRKEMTDYITALEAGGGTNFEVAFKKAFDVIDASRTKEATSNCKTAILFLTDGNSPNGPAARTLINNRNTAAIDARIFTYSLGSGATSTDPKLIACAHKGVHTKIEDGGNLLGKMTAYYQYFAAGITNNQTVWTEEYTDASGLGQMVTAALPAYDNSRSPPLLIGVAGTDVLMSELVNFTDSKTALTFLQQRSKVCPNLNLTECQIEVLRGSDTCGVSGCSSNINFDDNPCASGSTSSKISDAACNADGSTLGDPQCCCVPGWAWALIAVGGALTIATAGVLIKRHRTKKAAAEKAASDNASTKSSKNYASGPTHNRAARPVSVGQPVPMQEYPPAAASTSQEAQGQSNEAPPSYY